MFRKYMQSLVMLFGLLAAFADPVMAVEITSAEITKLSCKDYTIHVTGTAGTADCVRYQFVLAPDSGSSTTVTGKIPVDGPFDTAVNGSFTLTTNSVFTGSGFATLRDSCLIGSAIVNTVPINFGGVTPLDCGTPPSPKIEIRKFTNGHDGDNADGVPDPIAGGFATGTNTVAEIGVGSPVTWTYLVTNVGSEDLIGVQVSDDRLGAIDCPLDALGVGESMECTSAQFAESLVLNPPLVVGGCGDNRPTYANTGTVNAVGASSGTAIEDSNPSHYCNPKPSDCTLDLNKSCEIAQAPTTDWATCKGKLQQFTLIWPSDAGTINISGIANDAPGGVVNPGQKVTFTGPFSVNDQYLTISGAANGQSTFHVSCSDADMDGRTTTNLSQPQLPGKAQDCGKFEGNGKALAGTWINSWLLDGLIDATIPVAQVLNCSGTPTPPTSSCSFQASDPPSCGTGGTVKPSTLTFQYTGGGCSTQSNSQVAGKTFCTGLIDPTKPVNVAFPGGTASNIAPGGTFTIPRTQTQSVITLTNSGGTESDSIHTSCSQPLIVGDVYFSLTLVAEDGIGVGKQVKYTYGVTNTGSAAVSDISVVDDKLGAIGSIASLAPGATQSLTATTLIAQTTTNVATVTGSSCPAPGVQSTATVTVVPPPPPPPCTVTDSFVSLTDDNILYKVTNPGTTVVTLDTLLLNFPSNRGAIKSVSVGRNVVFDSTKSSLVVLPGVTIGATNWTNSDVAKRQWKAGAAQDLKITFTKKAKANASAFSGAATFKEGCTINLAP